MRPSNPLPATCRHWLFGLLALLAAGCAPVGPDYQPPALDLPAGWSRGPEHSQRADVTALARWWTLFNDPTLDTLITRAAAGSPDLRIAAARVREARGQRRLAAAGTLPAVDATGSYTTSRRSDNTGGSGGNDDLFSAGFDAAWELDLFGRLQRRVEAADATLQASMEEHRDALVTLSAEVARTYLELRTAEHRLAIARDTIRLQEQTSELVHGKFALGLAGRLEIHQTDSLLALSRAEVPTLETAAAQATHRLALLLGEQPADLGRVAGQVGRIPQVPAHLPLTLPSDLLRQRPDIRAAERQLAAATATVGATVAELFPRFSLGALLGLQASSLGDLLSRSSRFWTIGPAVRWPLFDGGAIRAGIEISEARRDQARAEYEKTLLTALAETEDALVALDRERVKQQQLAAAVVAADQALTAARGLYTAGLTPFLNVLQSEATLFQARDRLAESDQRLALALVALYKALGGGWQSAAAEPHPAPPPT